jgi:hypothetical protein
MKDAISSRDGIFENTTRLGLPIFECRKNLMIGLKIQVKFNTHEQFYFRLYAI